jgi:hypothetical protein
VRAKTLREISKQTESFSTHWAQFSARGLAKVKDLEAYVKRRLVAAGDFKDIQKKVASQSMVSLNPITKKTKSNKAMIGAQSCGSISSKFLELTDNYFYKSGYGLRSKCRSLKRSYAEVGSASRQLSQGTSQPFATRISSTWSTAQIPDFPLLWNWGLRRSKMSKPLI